ncbi:MAG TPA: hypothetical protein VFX76_19265, partial [Roseiflexaceae bacterium]|nr:hypothetical protein [Roseiflexaceae bacterium]
EMLGFYCHALTERRVELQDLQQLVDKNIGWSKHDVATSDGAAIFLPSVVERFESQSDNYDFLKVMLTQQAGHLEFGSFEFEFDRPSTQFTDWRPKIAAPPDYHDHDHGHEGHHEQAAVTELTKFFKLFPNKRLALDIFSIVESARVEARVMQQYRGIAIAYGAMRQRTLTLRQESVFLPAREALLEFMVRLSLGLTGGIKVPKSQAKIARDIRTLMQLAGAKGATVEDAAEATLRIYARLARVKNDYLEENEFMVLEPEQRGPSKRTNSRRSNSSRGSNRWKDQDEYQVLPELNGREREYLAPQGVDYRGEFRPELAQLLTKAQANSREQRKSLTPEELADLLRSQRTPKPRDGEDDGDEQDPQTSQMVQNLMKELDQRDPRMQSVTRRPSPNNDDDAGPLSANQPNTFIYDEWDAEAHKYRERWCTVYEKNLGTGD